ncbi:TonB-dependent receptor plug domain-containing protein [Zeaxanthinibacter enoshimensis]|uniref:Vitamin B12 transporter n=1 Tax=Zeaxanthinibacter enoshimensis TaxID=392009 RepID=A0A4R6TH71_9FLAO|nr:TonB-dependent receptor plug domain-containing protein [Zeaxanthinibacter enoshimensis]TDQ29458.1 vitamin B12 transporter [Zeaxanthinibacter enoshimensis]
MNKRPIIFCSALLAYACVYAQEIPGDSAKVEILDEVVVSDSRFALKREYSGKTVISIGPEELQKYSGRSVAEVINTRSGLEIAGSRGRPGEVLGVYARGGRGRQVLVLIDGVRVTDPSSFAQEYDLRYLGTDNIESIEIIKGAASTLYGSNAATAVISITTRKASGETASGNFESSMGTNQSHDKQQYKLAEFSSNARVDGTLGDFSYKTSFSSAYSDNLSSLVTPGDEEDEFSRFQANLSLGYRFSPKSSLRVYGNQSKLRSDYDESFGLQDAPYQFRSEQKRAGLAGIIGYRNGDININAAVSEFESENISAFPGTFRGQTWVVDAFNKYTFNDKFYTLFGINYNKEKAVLEGDQSFTLLDPYVNAVYVSGTGLNLNAGLRLNTHSEYGEQMVYNLNPSYSIAAGEGYVKVLASWATSYITPSLSQLFGAFGANPELEPETDRTLEGGLEWAASDRFRTSVLYFNREEENFVFFDNVAFVYNNAANTVKAEGVELEVSWLASEKWSVSGNYTFTERSGDSAIRIPKHKLNASIDYSFGEEGVLSLRYAYTGSRRDTDFSTFTDVELQPFSLLHLYASKELIPGRLKVFLNAENILNEDYTEVLGFSTRGRNLRLGFILDL